MYLVARTTEGDKYYQRLHAVDRTGAGSPVLIRATSREASFHSVREDQRARAAA